MKKLFLNVLFISIICNFLTLNADPDKDLLLAAKEGNLSMVKKAIREGADIDIKDKDGNTVLMIAALKDYPSLVKYLLKYVDLIVRNNQGKNVLDLARTEKIKNLIQEQGGNELLYAVDEGDIIKVRNLLDSGINVNFQNIAGLTALHLARDLKMAKLLIDRGADLDLATGFGGTPLMNAVIFGPIEKIKLLLEKGADVNKALNNGDTPLHKAAYFGNLEIVKLLLDYGADPTLKNNEGKTALDMAKNPAIREYLELKTKTEI